MVSIVLGASVCNVLVHHDLCRAAPRCPHSAFVSARARHQEAATPSENARHAIVTPLQWPSSVALEQFSACSVVKKAGSVCRRPAPR